MDRKTSVAAIGLLPILVGCAELGVRGCGDREVTVNHRAAYLSARPETVTLCRGDTLTVKLVPPVAPGDANTAPGPENPEAGWLSGSNRDRGQILLVVDARADVGRTYKYSIEVEGGGVLDPRVTVARH